MLHITETDNAGKKKYRKSYTDCRTALVNLFVASDKSPSEKFCDKLRKAMKGIKRHAASARGQDGGRLETGKAALSFQVYRALCKWILEDDDGVFAHCFLTLTWNLMCRSKNTVSIHRAHMEWRDDCLGIMFAHTKTDPTGDNAMRCRHVYANPFEPELCAITSLARYLLSNPSTSGWQVCLFEGTHQYDRFRKALDRTLENHRDEVVNLGMNPDDIGVHSIRKGAATYVCNGTEGTVSFAAVCRRAGWTMGNVKDRYIHHDAAGDHVVGRCVAGLNLNSKDFCVSSPVFDTSVEKKDFQNDVDSAINSTFGDILPKYRPLARHLLASLIFHHDFHQKKISRNSRFRSTVAFRQLHLQTIKSHVVTCFPWKNIQGLWKVNFTGLMPLSLMFQEFEKQSIKIDNMETSILGRLETLFEEHAERLFSDKGGLNGGAVSIEILREQLLDPILKKLGGMSSQSKNDADAKSPAIHPLMCSMNVAPDPGSFEFNTKASPFDAWIHFHHGEERTLASSRIVRSIPWSKLQEVHLKGKVERGKKTKNFPQRNNLYLLKDLCHRLDTAANIDSKKKAPSIKEMQILFRSKPVQDLFDRFQTTNQGRHRRLAQLGWPTLARLFQFGERKTTLIKQSKRPSPSATKARKRVKKEGGMGKPKIYQWYAQDNFYTKLSQQVLVEDLTGNESDNDDRSKKYGADDDDIYQVWEEKTGNLQKRSCNPCTARPLPLGAKMADCLRPNPSQPNLGRVIIHNESFANLMAPAAMLNDELTTGYLNLLMNHHMEYDGNVVKLGRSEPDFVQGLKAHLEKFGGESALSRYSRFLTDIECGASFIDWTTDDLIVLQIFDGPRMAGHWTLIIIDRTICNQESVVFFDSLPAYNPKLFENMKKLLMVTRVVSCTTTSWIRADIPKQGSASNDCGVFMCCLATAYLQAAITKRGTMSSFSGVEYRFCNSMSNTRTWGRLARSHMVESLETGEITEWNGGEIIFK